MLTIPELATAPLLSPLPERALAQIAKSAADVRLSAGEYAVHEGEERALFVVLEGRIEVTKRFDGIERTIGWRQPGQIFGEVPIALGGLFLGSYRAAEPSRVARMDARLYHAIAAMAPEIAQAVGALAGERIGGLQGLAASAPAVQVTVVGRRWDTASYEIRRFLARNQVSFDWIDADDPDLPSRMPDHHPMRDGYPTLVLADGSTLVQPRPREVAERLGLQTCGRHTEYDTVVIGGGPAGLAAAVYGASEGLRTLVVEREAPGGQAGTSSRIENYLCFPNGISGDELASRALQQARRLGAEILVTRHAVRIDPASHAVHLDGDAVVCARSIIIATGVSWRRLEIDGAERLIGKGVAYGAARSEALNTQDLDIHLIGAGNSAGQAALFFANHARTVTLLVRGESLEKSMSHYLIEKVVAKSNIVVKLNTEVRATHGESHLTAVDVLDRRSGEVRRCECAGLFAFIGADAQTGWLPPEVARDANGYVLTGTDAAQSGHWSRNRDPYLLETTVPGIFACGDVRYSPVKRVASAVGEGSMAIAFTHQYLRLEGAART